MLIFCQCLYADEYIRMRFVILHTDCHALVSIPAEGYSQHMHNASFMLKMVLCIVHSVVSRPLPGVLMHCKIYGETNLVIMG